MILRLHNIKYDRDRCCPLSTNNFVMKICVLREFIQYKNGL